MRVRNEDIADLKDRRAREAGHSWGSLAHIVFWCLLFVGFWFQWRPMMLVGFALTVSNITTFGGLFAANVAVAIGVMIANPKSVAGENLMLASILCLIAQVWQFRVWIQGVAAN